MTNIKRIAAGGLVGVAVAGTMIVAGPTAQAATATTTVTTPATAQGLCSNAVAQGILALQSNGLITPRSPYTWQDVYRYIMFDLNTSGVYGQAGYVLSLRAQAIHDDC